MGGAAEDRKQEQKQRTGNAQPKVGVTVMRHHENQRLPRGLQSCLDDQLPVRLRDRELRPGAFVRQIKVAV